MSRKPIAIALLASEQVVIEEKTRNITAVNCFARRELRDFSSEPITFAVLGFLTDGQGEIDLEIVVEQADNTEVIHRVRRRFRFAHPLEEYRCYFRLRDFSFPSEGVYEIVLWADGEWLASRTIKVVRRRPQ